MEKRLEREIEIGSILYTGQILTISPAFSPNGVLDREVSQIGSISDSELITKRLHRKVLQHLSTLRVPSMYQQKRGNFGMLLGDYMLQ